MDLLDLSFALATLRLSMPLALAALGELVAERSGVLNIGVEGMMLAGALAAYAASVASGSAAIGLLASALGGAALATIFAAFVLVRRADPVVCGTALNLLSLGVTGAAYRAWLSGSTMAISAPRSDDWLGVNVFLWLTLAVAIAIGVVLARTRAGLTVRAVGESANAAHAQGVAVLRTRWTCTLLGGALAGMAGASLVLWISDRFVESMTSGRGFIALALVLFGGYSVPRIVGGACLFGLASALQFRLQAMGWSIDYNLLLMLPYLLTLAALAFATPRSRPPADLAQPFDAEGR